MRRVRAEPEDNDDPLQINQSSLIIDLFPTINTTLSVLFNFLHPALVDLSKEWPILCPSRTQPQTLKAQTKLLQNSLEFRSALYYVLFYYWSNSA